MANLQTLPLQIYVLIGHYGGYKEQFNTYRKLQKAIASKKMTVLFISAPREKKDKVGVVGWLSYTTSSHEQWTELIVYSNMYRIASFDLSHQLTAFVICEGQYPIKQQALQDCRI